MDIAVVHRGSSESIVTAEEYQCSYGAGYRRDIRLTCPYCNQPVRACAMGSNHYQAPHFKHLPNNPIAQQCEEFAANRGSSTLFTASTYQRVPLPLYLVPTHQSDYLLEAALSPLDDDEIRWLAQDDYWLALGTRNYKISRERFPRGKRARLQYGVDGETLGSGLKLENEQYYVDDIWSDVEPLSNGCMLFHCEDPTFAGMRVRHGDTISPGEHYKLVYGKTTGRDTWELVKRRSEEGEFTESGSIAGSGGRMLVADVVFSRTLLSIRYIAREIELALNVIVDLSYSAPRLVWPPSLGHTGDYVRLFGRGPAVITSGDMRRDRMAVEMVYYGGSGLPAGAKMDKIVNGVRFGEVEAGPETTLVGVGEEGMSDLIAISPKGEGEVERRLFDVQPKPALIDGEVHSGRPCTVVIGGKNRLRRVDFDGLDASRPLHTENDESIIALAVRYETGRNLGNWSRYRWISTFTHEEGDWAAENDDRSASPHALANRPQNSILDVNISTIRAARYGRTQAQELAIATARSFSNDTMLAKMRARRKK